MKKVLEGQRGHQVNLEVLVQPDLQGSRGHKVKPGRQVKLDPWVSQDLRALAVSREIMEALELQVLKGSRERLGHKVNAELLEVQDSQEPQGWQDPKVFKVRRVTQDLLVRLDKQGSQVIEVRTGLMDSRDHRDLRVSQETLVQ